MAFLTGFLGSGHCLGMCGGIVTALALTGQGRPRGWPFHLLYNLGRTTTYTLIGLAVGWLGSAIAFTDAFSRISRGILVGSDLFVIALGLGTAGLYRRLNIMRLETSNVTVLSRVVSHLQHLPGSAAGLPLGLAMGLLPCGFLYAVAITAAQSASPWKGALTLLCFGLGTAPGLVLFGGGAHWLGRRMRQGMLRAAGGVVALMGVYNLWRHGSLLGWWS